METPLIEVHRAAGARLAEYDGCVLPEEFSEFDKEYRAATEAVALFDTNWHAIFTLAGRDRVKYLHAISSNDIKSLAEGQGTLALLLNPQGRILAELAVYALAEKLLVLSHASLREQTLATLREIRNRLAGADRGFDRQAGKLGRGRAARGGSGDRGFRRRARRSC